MKTFVIGGLVSQVEVGDDAQFTFQHTCRELGLSLAEAGHQLIVCSPFDSAADVQVLRGAASTPEGRAMRVEFHFVDMPQVREELERLISELRLTQVTQIPYPPPHEDSKESRRYAWLLCQLNALDLSHAAIAVGGDPNGAANMLLLLAEGRGKPVLPLPILGGAAEQSFDRRRYELMDRLGQDYALLQKPGEVRNMPELATILAGPVRGGMRNSQFPPKVFISYARARQAEADHLETVLRRRNLSVFRDESEFGAGYSVPEQIRQAIFGANIIIVLWSAEYACSPWCFDELDLALDRQSNGVVELWILRIDTTRLVPKRARELVYYDTPSREQLEGRVVVLLEQFLSESRH